MTGATWEDDVGYDCRVTARAVHQILNETMHLAPGLGTATLTEVRIGFRPAIPDLLPVLGRVPGLPNVVLATGLGRNGLQWGRMWDRSLPTSLGLGVDIDLEPFSVRRFQ